MTGGKNLKDEREQLTQMNTLVTTPGWLLQHMNQTFGFECDNLQVLSKFHTVHPHQGLTILVLKFWAKRIAC